MRSIAIRGAAPDGLGGRPPCSPHLHSSTCPAPWPPSMTYSIVELVSDWYNIAVAINTARDRKGPGKHHKFIYYFIYLLTFFTTVHTTCACTTMEL